MSFAGAVEDYMDPVAAFEKLPMAKREAIERQFPSERGVGLGSLFPASPVLRRQQQPTNEGTALRHCCLE